MKAGTKRFAGVHDMDLELREEPNGVSQRRPCWAFRNRSRDNIEVMSSGAQKTRATTAMGLKLKELREAAGITQRELAERLGSQQPAIARLENGHVKPDVVTLERIAKALGYRFEMIAVPFDEAINNGVPVRFP